MLDSMEGFAYPSGHSTTSNLLCMVLCELYPDYKKDFNKICKNQNLFHNLYEFIDNTNKTLI